MQKGFREEYDNIIEMIEEMLELDREEICLQLSRHTGRQVRGISDNLQFIAGCSLHDYIRQRKAERIIAYVRAGKGSLETAVTEAYRYSAQYDSFYKWFHRRYGIGPEQAVRDGGAELTPPLYLDTLLSSRDGASDQTMV